MLTAKNIRKKFRSHEVLKGLELEVNAGDRVALVGQNGCGKTTLIRCLLGLYQFEGEIEISGSNVRSSREEALKKIAFVPQIPPALKNTVKEMISLGSNLTGMDVERVHLYASQLGLEISHCKDTPFKGLSGGMKQKLLISIALARRPQVLIMDEPSANLDPQARAVFFRLLSELPQETTMLLTSHRVDELAGIVNRVIELDGGVITMDDVVETRSNDFLTGKQHCVLELRRTPPTVGKALQEWSFKQHEGRENVWEGIIPVADSFRFHATLTRWSGIVKGVHIKSLTEEGVQDENVTTGPYASHSKRLSGSGRHESAGAALGKGALCPVSDGLKREALRGSTDS